MSESLIILFFIYSVFICIDLYSLFSELRSVSYSLPQKPPYSKRRYTTSLGSLLGEYVDIASRKIYRLSHEKHVQSLVLPSHPKLEMVNPSLERLNSLRRSYFDEVVDFLLQKFTASGVSILFEDSQDLLHQYSSSKLERSLLQFLPLYFDSYFRSGFLGNFGWSSTLLGGQFLFSRYGIKSVLALPFGGNVYRGVVVLLYSEHTPLDIEERWLKETTQALTDEIVGFEQYIRNQYESNRLQSENVQKSKLISHISHDIRSPLHNIRSVLELLKEEHVSDETVHFTNIALKNCDIMNEILETLLDYSAQQSGNLSVQPVEISLRQMLTDLVESYTVAANLKGIELNLICDEESKVFVDRRHAKRIFTNLISNAIKYTSAGSVSIIVEEKETQAVVHIKDTGIGMSKSDLSQLFTPFTRFSKSTAEGVGLGLAVTKNLIEINQCEIDVKSKYGKGTVFSLSIPLASEGLISDPAFSKTEIKKPAILIVDDDVEYTKSMTRILEPWGAQVFVAHGVHEALGLIHFEKLDLIITDDSMPQGGGERLLKGILDSNPNMKVILLSGNERSRSDEYLNILPHSRRLMKPVTPAEILENIELLSVNKAAA